MLIEQEIEFFNYVYGFYGVGGLYGMNFNDNEIKAAIAMLKISNRFVIEFVGDSIDREHVLVILEENFIKEAA